VALEFAKSLKWQAERRKPGVDLIVATGARAGAVADQVAELVRALRVSPEAVDVADPCQLPPVPVVQRIGTYVLIHSLVKQRTLTGWNLYVRVRLGADQLPADIQWPQRHREHVAKLGFYLLLGTHPEAWPYLQAGATRMQSSGPRTNINRVDAWELVHLWNLVLRRERAAADGESGSASVAVGVSAYSFLQYPYPEDTKGNRGQARDPAEYDFAGPQDYFPGRRQLSVFCGVTQAATGCW
jgi:hypothetical protein